MRKISFLGDCICQPSFLRAAAARGFEFKPAFARLKNLLADSDYVVGNLETPIAGAAMGYTRELYSFNTPGTFVDALSDIGVDLFQTANNHALDRGLEGLRHTLDELDDRGLRHVGTYRCQDDADKIFVEKIGDTKVAFLAYNAAINKQALQNVGGQLRPWHIKQCCNPYRYWAQEPSIPFYRVRSFIGDRISPHLVEMAKHAIGLKNRPYVDSLRDASVYENELPAMRKAIAQAKKQSDITILLAHTGGQYNVHPGESSIYVCRSAVEAGADLVVGTHAHCIQGIDTLHGDKIVYSLGNVSIASSSPSVLKECLPEYGMVLHAYVDDGKMVSLSYSLIRVAEDANHYLEVYPVDEIKKENLTDNVLQEIKAIHERISRPFAETNGARIQREYVLR